MCRSVLNINFIDNGKGSTAVFCIYSICTYSVGPAPGQLEDQRMELKSTAIDGEEGGCCNEAKWSLGEIGISGNSDEGFGRGSSEKELDSKKGCGAEVTKKCTGTGKVMKACLLQKFESADRKCGETWGVGGDDASFTFGSGGANVPGNCHVGRSSSHQDGGLLLHVSDDHIDDISSTLFGLEITELTGEESSNGLPVVDPASEDDRVVAMATETRGLKSEGGNADGADLSKTVTKQVHKTANRTGGVAEKKNEVETKGYSVFSITQMSPLLPSPPPRVGKSSSSTCSIRPRPQKPEQMSAESAVAFSKTSGVRTHKG